MSSVGHRSSALSGAREASSVKMKNHIQIGKGGRRGACVHWEIYANQKSGLVRDRGHTKQLESGMNTSQVDRHSTVPEKLLRQRERRVTKPRLRCIKTQLASRAGKLVQDISKYH